MTIKDNRSLIYKIVFTIILTSLIGGMYFDAISELVTRWNSQEEYSHGYFIPLVVLYFIYRKRDLILQEEAKPTYSGIFLVILSLLMLIIGELSAIYIISQYSFLILIIGLVLTFFGKRVTSLMFVPIVIGAFAIPLPYFIESDLTWRLQILSSELGVSIIRFFDIPVFLEGNIIDLGIYKLQVVEACSGLNYLYPLMSFGFIVAYIYRAPFLYKSIVFLSTIPITILMNSVRIGIVGVLVSYGGIDMAEGFLHYFEGWLIFMTCIGLLFVETWILTKLIPGRPNLDTVIIFNPVSKKSYMKVLALRFSAPLTVASLIIIVAAFFISNISNREEIKHARNRFDTFPKIINQWKLTQEKLMPSIIQKLKFDDYFLGNYVKDDVQSIELYIAYYESQRKGVSPHSPRVCIPGEGWHINALERKVIKLDNDYTLPINRVIIEKNEAKQLVYYWFEQRGRSIANEYSMKWYLLIDAIIKNRTDGALVRFTTNLDVNETENIADKRIIEIINSVYPVLESYIPK